MYRLLLATATLVFLFQTCLENKKEPQENYRPAPIVPDSIVAPSGDTIVDANFSFEEAIRGTKAPQSIIDQLVLFGVVYRSIDGELHRGQILTNRKLEKDIRQMFEFMLAENFEVEKVVPIVRYGWNDSLSMADNNTYSFCYRNVSYSKHATGMAIDINPRFNPLRWKRSNRPNQPMGAVSDTTVWAHCTPITKW